MKGADIAATYVAPILPNIPPGKRLGGLQQVRRLTPVMNFLAARHVLALRHAIEAFSVTSDRAALCLVLRGAAMAYRCGIRFRHGLQPRFLPKQITLRLAPAVIRSRAAQVLEMNGVIQPAGLHDGDGVAGLVGPLFHAKPLAAELEHFRHEGKPVERAVLVQRGENFLFDAEVQDQGFARAHFCNASSGSSGAEAGPKAVIRGCKLTAPRASVTVLTKRVTAGKTRCSVFSLVKR